MASKRERETSSVSNGLSQRRKSRTSPPRDDHDEEEEEEEAPRTLQRSSATTSYSFALVNWGSGGGSEGGVALLVEVVRSCERIVVDARCDVLHTLRYLANFASVVAVTAIVGYCLVQIVPHL